MMNDRIILTCLRCGHEWQKRTVKTGGERPQSCPSCRSRQWWQGPQYKLTKPSKLTYKSIAKSIDVSVSTYYRCRFIRAYGSPEVNAKASSGELSAYGAFKIARREKNRREREAWLAYEALIHTKDANCPTECVEGKQ